MWKNDKIFLSFKLFFLDRLESSSRMKKEENIGFHREEKKNEVKACLWESNSQ